MTDGVNRTKTRVIYALFVAAALSLVAAFSFPVAKYSVASKAKIEDLFGGAEGVQQLYQGMATHLSNHIQENSDDIEASIIDFLDDKGVCIVPGLCTTLKQGNGVLVNMMTKAMEPGLVEFGNDKIDQFYDTVSSFLYDEFQKTKYAEISDPNIFQAVQILAQSNELYLAVVILVFSIFFPIAKLIVSIFDFVKKDSVFADNLYSITSKFSLAEVFVVAVLIVSAQSIPFLSIEAGIISITGYLVFTFSLIGVDLVRTWKTAPNA